MWIFQQSEWNSPPQSRKSRFGKPPLPRGVGDLPKFLHNCESSFLALLSDIRHISCVWLDACIFQRATCVLGEPEELASQLWWRREAAGLRFPSRLHFLISGLVGSRDIVFLTMSTGSSGRVVRRSWGRWHRRCTPHCSWNIHSR